MDSKDMFGYLVINNLCCKELAFLKEAPECFVKASILSIKQLNKSDTKKTLKIPCKNSYERRIVHVLSEAFNIYHRKEGDFIVFGKKMNRQECLRFVSPDDWMCGCNLCHINVGQFYICNSVRISNYPIKLTKRDIYSARKYKLSRSKCECMKNKIK